MHGQWIGQNEGPNQALVIMDIDDGGDYCSGHFYFHDNAEDLPGMVGKISLTSPFLPYEGKIEVQPLHPRTGTPTTRVFLKEKFPDVQFPDEISITLNISESNRLVANWYSSNILSGNYGRIEFVHYPKKFQSNLQPISEISDWESFKRFVLNYPPEKFIFRGQSNNNWPLQTSFHRSSRTDLIPFIEKDVPRLYQRLSSHLKFQYDLNNSEQYAAFLNLLQHHGYPTPLLDWTYSPFVAAYFAFRSFAKTNKTNDFVRIFVFNIQLWNQIFPQLDRITYALPHFSVFQPLSYDNLRAAPQQSILSATNIMDIERYIKLQGDESNQNYLSAIDIPSVEFKKALSELSMMGISEATLFPSIDGVCEEMRQKLF